MRCTVLGVCLLLAGGPALRAADDKPDLTPAAEVKKLTEDFNKAQQDFYDEYGKAKTQEEKDKLVKEKMPKPDKTAARLLELAEKNAKDEGVVPDALIWVVNYSNGAEAAKGKERALELLTNHLDDAKVGDLCLRLSYNPSPNGEKLMRTIMAQGVLDDSKGKATFGLGQYLKQMAEGIRTMKDQPEMIKNYEEAYGKDTVEHLQKGDPDAMAKEAEKLFETAGEKYGSVKIYNRPLSEMVEGELFEIRNLAIGKTAPDIAGDDLDGKAFKLSEYRGKVVVLDFWGNW
jgi:hypothetical protein